MEPWKLRTESIREADSRTTFIIFCEDGEIEPTYFDRFKTDLIKVSPIKNCGQHHRQVDYATDYCRIMICLKLLIIKSF